MSTITSDKRNIWEFLADHGFEATPRPSKKTVMLALDHSKLNNAQLKRMPDNYIMEEKVDGIYTMVVCINIAGAYTVKCFGRSGKALSGLEYISDKYKKALEIAGDTRSHIFLTEAISSFGATGLAKFSGYTNPKRTKEATHIPEWISDKPFDYITIPEFVAGKSDEVFFVRKHNLINILRPMDMLHKMVNMVNNIGNLDNLKHFSKFVIHNGGEGAMGKDPHAYWEAGKRDERQIKVKEEIDFDCTIIGYAMGREGSKYENTIGKLFVLFRSHGKFSGSPIALPVGSGLTDEIRDIILANPKAYLGKVVKIKAKSFHGTGNLREPVIVEFREDKDEGDFEAPLGTFKKYTKDKTLCFCYEV